jgi:hypothetical protein
VFRVKSKPAGGVLALSENHEVNTLAVPIVTSLPSHVSNIAASAGTSTATISWTTDKNTNAQMFYGITTSYQQQSDIDFTMQTAHSIALSNLTPTVQYHYRVRSIDDVNNITYSDDHTFAMQAVVAAPTLIPSTTTITAMSSTISSAATTTSASTSISTAAATIPSSTISTTTQSTAPSPAAVQTLAVANQDKTSATLTWNVTSTSIDTAAEYDNPLQHWTDH